MIQFDGNRIWLIDTYDLYLNRKAMMDMLAKRGGGEVKQKELPSTTDPR